TDELRAYLLQGGRVLWLPEREADQQTYVGSLSLHDRVNQVWEGDWANNLSWICRDRLFSTLPTKGLVDFLFAGLTPDAVITGLSAHEYASSVQAGLAVGWLHHAAALVAERPVGNGRLLVSTFKLADQLSIHPVAALMLADLVQYIVAQ